MYNAAESGNYGADHFENAFSSKQIRLGFIRKVYGILSVQLLITFGFVVALSASEGARKWTRENQWLFWVAFATTFVTIIMLSCCEGIRRQTPHNYIALFVFTLAESFLVGVVSSIYNYKIVLTAVLITAAICIALTIFAFQTKWDFTVYNGLLFVLLLVLCIFGIITIFWRDPIVHLIYASLGALLFAAYLVIDTQMIVGGNHKLQVSPEEYVFASLTLYLDIINIFIYVLQILQSLSND